MHQNRRKAPVTKGQALDQYYTKASVVDVCLAAVGDLTRYDHVIEPSAGNGAFYHRIVHPCKLGIDVDPGDPQFLRQDWLSYSVGAHCASVLVIGNPPYGRYHRLSSAFIAHAVAFSNVQTVAFILPNVYRKHTRQRIIPPDFRIVSVTDLGRNAFELDGVDYHVPTSFFVFDRSEGKDLRADPTPVAGTADFEFSSSNDYDLFVFGANPRKITPAATSNNRGYFLKARINVEELQRRILAVNWSGNSSASGGVYWLTKREFAEQYAHHHGKALLQARHFGRSDPMQLSITWGERNGGT